MINGFNVGDTVEVEIHESGLIYSVKAKIEEPHHDSRLCYIRIMEGKLNSIKTVANLFYMRHVQAIKCVCGAGHVKDARHSHWCDIKN